MFSLLIMGIYFSSIKGNVYLYFTEDSLSVEYYDCLYHQSFLYCRRPEGSLNLDREHTWTCFHQGVRHRFKDMHKRNISVNTIVYQWKSTLEMADRYARYRREPNDEHDGFICQCKGNSQAFGKFCEYIYPIGETFEQTINGELELRKLSFDKYVLFTDILCYETLQCNSGLLCLDWRDICDGLQQCMFGIDEINCEHLEFNECDENEYRCMNGMCVPNEYFLDGDYDCMDMSDEKPDFENHICPFEQVRLECDERFCLPYEWSCGDGQCIRDRLAFRGNLLHTSICHSQRDQVFLCEFIGTKPMWTLDNGKCYPSNDHQHNLTDRCLYFLKCSLTAGLEASCPCNDTDSCLWYMPRKCLSANIFYPDRAVLAPYLFTYFDLDFYTAGLTAVSLRVNGTILCRGNLFEIDSDVMFIGDYERERFEIEQCSTLLLNNQSQTCFHHSRTFNNRSYYFIDICQQSRECISAYRIRDGFANCIDELDEQTNQVTCSNMKTHRFTCSVNNDSTCLMINTLGNIDLNCQNKYDESWMGTGTKISKLTCSDKSKDDCQTLRDYIQTSWSSDTNVNSQLTSNKVIAFRAYCDSFWDFYSKIDEDKRLCQQWWTCLDHQWQCQTGQCIDKDWVLDGEWDCTDASDEEAIFTLNETIRQRNEKLISQQFIDETFDRLYRFRPLMSICDPTKEFACFQRNSSRRSCISIHRLGDGIVDCLGAVDEQNTEEQCQRATMLGKNFKCLSSSECIPYSMLCEQRCRNPQDDQGFCLHSNCSKSNNDFVCLDGKCIANGRCDNRDQCDHHEDEYLCSNSIDFTSVYRQGKELGILYENQPFDLPHFPFHVNQTQRPIGSLLKQTNSMNFSQLDSSPIVYKCNRGVGIFTVNQTIVCFCPQPYYGDRCQFYNDRLTVLLHLNFSQSIYATSNDSTVVLKLLVLFLEHDQVLSSYEFHARPSTELQRYFKKLDHLIYSRTNQSLANKRRRYADRANIVNQHPYSIRIEAYEIKIQAKPKLVAVWAYPIYFDYLPAFRFSKVLYLTQPSASNSCSTNPCGPNQICQPILNENSKYICLCQENYFGDNCSQIAPICLTNYCSPHSLCKPTYRGLLNRPELPYCICPMTTFGFQCYLEQDQCESNPCLNNGTCFPSATPGHYFCICNSLYRGVRCQFEQNIIRLELNQTKTHRAAIVQYFQIDFSDLILRLNHRELFEIMPKRLFYRYNRKYAPEIVLVKLYVESHLEIYLLSLQLYALSIDTSTELSESNHCPFISNLSPIQYHHICRTHRNLLCFHDGNYLCLCNSNHTRAECFVYDHSLDRCSLCLASGRCIRDSKNFLCLCSACHSGRFCQFSSKSFSFTLDQLFSADLLSTNTTHRLLTIYFLTISSLLMFILGLINNIFSFMTFSQKKCRKNGSGQYLLFMSVISPLNLAFLTLRLCHLIINITGQHFSLQTNIILCTFLNYSLTITSRISQWLVSLLAIERVYTIVFLNKHWLKKPIVARRLIFILIITISITGAYELPFFSSHSGFNDNQGGICFLEFPLNQSFWFYIHQFIRIVNSVVPFLINLISMIIIIYVVIKKKIKINRKNICMLNNNKKTKSSLCCFSLRYDRKNYQSNFM